MNRRIGTILVAALTIAWACALAGPSAAGASHARVAHARAHHSPTCVASRRSRRGTRKASYRNSHRAHHVTRCVRRHATHHTVKPHRSHSPVRKHSAAGSAGGCADTDLAPATWNVERIRAAVLCLVNRERATHGEGALQTNPRIEQAAQSHTESMAFGGYFEHVGPRGDTPVDRMRASGYIYSSRVGYEIAENLAWGTGGQGTPRSIVAAWMASAGHRANILDAHFRDTAVGVSPHVPGSMGGGQAGGIYTQDFGVLIGG
ncbi:MAG TPA: CAP domain-containing protein [Solirubrobacteraceae bacterium]|nr:CAP domain-containing protein [Solirubrobacteraceae bacterium]